MHWYIFLHQDHDRLQSSFAGLGPLSRYPIAATALPLYQLLIYGGYDRLRNIVFNAYDLSCLRYGTLVALLWKVCCFSWTLQLRDTLVSFIIWGRGCLCNGILVVPATSDVKRLEEKWKKKACVSRQDNDIISDLLNLLKERADSFIKYIFASAIFYQKISKSSKQLCHDKKQKHSWGNSRNIASREISTNIVASARRNNISTKEEKICIWTS